MKKPLIIGISSSKVRDNAEKLLEAALRGCKEENADVKLILLRNIDEEYFNVLMEDLIASQGIIISVPIREKVSLIDKLKEFLKECNERPLFLGKKASFILTGPIIDELKNYLYETESFFSQLGFNVEKSATVVDIGELNKDDIGLCVIIGRNLAKE